MAPFLSGCVIAIAGELAAEEGDYWHDFTAANVERWVRCWGGRFAPDACADDVTHLLCTVDTFRRRVPAVRAALRPADDCPDCPGPGPGSGGSGGIGTGTGRKRPKRQKRPRRHIVLPEWLQESLGKRRRFREGRFAVQACLAAERARTRRGEQARRGMELAEDNYVDPNKYHIFRDSENFEYQVNLTRDEETHGGRLGQRHILTLWESNDQPRLYHVTTKFLKQKGAPKPGLWRAHESPQRFDAVFAEFRSFFLKKTGRRWGERLLAGAGAGPGSAGKFQYQPPTGGKPVGLTDIAIDVDEEEGSRDDRSSRRRTTIAPNLRPALADDDDEIEADVVAPASPPPPPDDRSVMISSSTSSAPPGCRPVEALPVPDIGSATAASASASAFAAADAAESDGTENSDAMDVDGLGREEVVEKEAEEGVDESNDNNDDNNEEDNNDNNNVPNIARSGGGGAGGGDTPPATSFPPEEDDDDAGTAEAQ
ncbi:hypothetical protein GGR56DRAFT_688164 [Xylariaceae sp. FL0804]|nr:hypothetical protein GGR56DRAFT_688164 [Xylariaceae sp. FL0804]